MAEEMVNYLSLIHIYKLVIPNKEVREVFVLQIQEWFKAVVAKDDDCLLYTSYFFYTIL